MAKRNNPAQPSTKTAGKILVRRDGPAGKQLATIGGANSTDPLKVADRLLTVLRTPDKQRRGSRLLFVEFSVAPAMVFRKTLIGRISEGLLADVREYFDGDDAPTDDELLDAEGWDGPRIVLPSRSGPSFTLSFTEEIDWYCGFWLNPTTLVLGVLDTLSPPEGASSVSAGHWHPDSRTSGSWRDHYAVLGNGLDFAWSSRDESGIYVNFRRSVGASPTSVAKSLESAVRDWYLYGAQYQLLEAHFLGFSKGTVELLRGDENLGYEIEDFTVSVADDVLSELKKRHPKPTPEEAGEWVAAIKEAVSEDLWEHYTTGSYADEFVLTLTAIAEGKS